MPRYLLVVVSSLTLSACVVQPPPGYWGRTPSPYTQAGYPSVYTQRWNTPPASETPFSAPPSAPWSARPALYAPQPASWPPEPASWSQGPEVNPPQSGNDTPSKPRNPRATFADEAVDYGTPPTNTLHLRDFDAPTPTRIEGANTITTLELENLMASDRPPVLVDVIGGKQSGSLPNAIWLRDAGVGRHLDDDVQAWFDFHLSQLTGHDKSHPLVFFCASRMCWLAHNATLRALDLGYTNVHWYRGGRDAWQAAGLPMTPVATTPVND
jgi:PQQ-dependent catabolism-associated CXXCW motif protein